jgi:hypothetical protein
VYVDEAIQFALESRWDEALATNESLIERHGPDEDTHNRLGKALTELGRPQEALEAYQNALQVNPLNQIAQKNSRKLLTMLEAPTRPAAAGAIDVDLFAEEPGKSGLTVLTAPITGGVAIAPGDTVELAGEQGALQARTVRGVFLGEIEAKLSRRLLPLMAGGNRYSGAVARIENDRIEVIIRETYQSPENVRKSSFPITRGTRRDDFRPYAKELLITRDDGGPLGTDDDLDDPVAADDEPEDDVAGIPPVEPDAEFEEVVGVDDEDDDDDTDVDVRPEDEY